MTLNKLVSGEYIGPVEGCPSVRVNVKYEKILYVYRRWHPDPNGSGYFSVVCFENGDSFPCKEDLKAIQSMTDFIRFKENGVDDILINKQHINYVEKSTNGAIIHAGHNEFVIYGIYELIMGMLEWLRN